MPFEEIAIWLFELIKTYGPLSVFLGVVLEEIIVPIPSSVVIMAAGALLIPAGISLSDAVFRAFFTIAVPASFGTVVGSFFVYGIGYYGGKPILQRLHRFLDFSWKDVEKISRKLGKGKKIWLSIFILRLIPVFPTSPVSFVAGALRLDIKKYALATFLGAVPRNFILAFFGWYFGSAYVSIAGSLNLLENIVLLSILLLVGYFLYKHHRHIIKHVDRHVGRRIREHIEKQRRKRM